MSEQLAQVPAQSQPIHCCAVTVKQDEKTFAVLQNVAYSSVHVNSTHGHAPPVAPTQGSAAFETGALQMSQQHHSQSLQVVQNSTHGHAPPVAPTQGSAAYETGALQMSQQHHSQSLQVVQPSIPTKLPGVVPSILYTADTSVIVPPTQAIHATMSASDYCSPMNGSSKTTTNRRDETFATKYRPLDVVRHIQNGTSNSVQDYGMNLRLGDVDFENTFRHMFGSDPPTYHTLAASQYCNSLKLRQMEREQAEMREHYEREIKALKRKIAGNSAPERYFPKAYAIIGVTPSAAGTYVTPETKTFRGGIDLSKAFLHFRSRSSYEGLEGIAGLKQIRVWSLFVETFFYMTMKDRSFFANLTSRINNRKNGLINIRNKTSQDFLCHDMLIDFLIESASLTEDEFVWEWRDGLREFVANSLYESRRTLLPDLKSKDASKTKQDPMEKFKSLIFPEYV